MRKTHRGATAIHDSGLHEPLTTIAKRDAAAVRARFGVIHPAFAKLLANIPGEQIVSFQLFFAVPELNEKLRKRAASGDPAIARAAAVETDRLITARAVQLRGALESKLGATKFSPSMPAMTGHAPARAVLALAHHPGLTFIIGADPLEPVLDAEGEIVDSIDWHGTDTAFNPDSQFAERARIGIVDQGDGCTLPVFHDAFSEAQIQHQSSSVLHCATDADCSPCTSVTVANSCQIGVCINAHAARVASVMMSGTTQHNPRGAARAEIFSANQGDASPYFSKFNSVACSATAIQDAYSWFRGSSVDIVNESYHCRVPAGGELDGRGLDGITQDWYAAYYAIDITKSAGNRKTSEDEEACPHSLNSICVGGARSNQTISCFSSFTNPTWSLEGKSTDREEPDVVALSGNARPDSGASDCTSPILNEYVKVLGLSSNSDWDGGNGSSFAAPAVAAMIALTRETCRAHDIPGPRGAQLRAMLRTAAWVNADGWPYSTGRGSASTIDHRDGGGIILAQNLRQFCAPDEGGDVTTGMTNGVQPLEEGEPLPDGPVEFPEEPPMAPTSMTKGDDAPGPGDGRKHVVIDRFSIAAGERLRYTVSWDACPTAVSGTAPAKVATDFDLFLYNRTAGFYVYTSQTVADNNEGFDVYASPGMEGEWEVLLAWPEGSEGCGPFGTVVHEAGWAGAWALIH